MGTASDIAALLSERCRASVPSAELSRLRTTTAISFGGGLPDGETYPTGDLADILGRLVARNEAATYAYGYEAGDPALRAAIARRAKANGIDLGEDGVVVTNGSSGALELAARAVVDPGDVVMVEALTYPAMIRVFTAHGARIEPIPLDEEGLDVDGLAAVVERLVRAGTPPKLLYTIATSQNPSGTTLARDRRERIVALARRCGFLILQDDTYGEIQYTADQPSPFLALAPERTIHAGSFSKTLAPGLRMGWAAANPVIAQGMASVRTDLGTTPILQRAIATMIDEGRFERHLAQVTPFYRRKRDRLDACLREMCADFGAWNIPVAGFFLWFRLFRKDIDAVIAQANDAGVAFLPGP